MRGMLGHMGGGSRPRLHLRWIVALLMGLIVVIVGSPGSHASTVGKSWSSVSGAAGLGPRSDSGAWESCPDAPNHIEAADAIVTAGEPTTYPAAKRLYRQVIRSGTTDDRACAARGLAHLLEVEKEEAENEADSAGWEKQLKKSWTGWTDAHVSPIKDAFLAGVGILVLLLVLARLLTGTVVGPTARSLGDSGRRAMWSVGLLLVAVASVSPIVASRTTVAADGWLVGVAVYVATALFMCAMVPWNVFGWNHAALATGCGLLLLSALAAPLFDMDMLLVAGLWAAVLGVGLVALARALALAIEVQVRGSSGDDNASTARFLVARLQELGATNPRNIRVLDASDVTSLPEDALTAVPTGALATAVFNVLKVVRPAAPWRITVTRPDDASIVVEVARNRSAVPDGSLVVAVDDLPEAAPGVEPADDQTKEGTEDLKSRDLDDLMTVAAAHALLVLKGPHHQLRVGLCGASDWRALAFHAIALRRGTPAERKTLLLQAAVDASPRYLLARMALVNETDDEDAAGREKYAQEITRLWTDFKDELAPGNSLNAVKAGYEAAQLRMLYNRAVAWANVRTDHAIDGKTDKAGKAWKASAAAAVSLDKRIKALNEDTPPALERLVEESTRPVAFLLLDLGQHLPHTLPRHSRDIVTLAVNWRGLLGSKLTPRNRNDYYARACYYAGLQGNPDMWKQALADLAMAGTDSRFATWAPKDPSLAVFGLGNEYGERAKDNLIETFKEILTDDPLTSYLELNPFKPYAAALKAYGLMELSDLAVVPRDDLASATKVHPSVAQRWLDAAGLEARLLQAGETSAAIRLQLMELLLSVDVVSRRHLAERLAGSDKRREEFYVKLVEAALGSRIVPGWDQTIKKWTGMGKPESISFRP